MTNDDIKELIMCIKQSAKKVEVATPSRDYYARRGDYDTETLEYIDPEKLIESLQERLE